MRDPILRNLQISTRSQTDTKVTTDRLPVELGYGTVGRHSLTCICSLLSCCLFHDCLAGCLSVLTVVSVCDRVERFERSAAALKAVLGRTVTVAML